MADAIQPLEVYILAGLQRRILQVFGLTVDIKMNPDPYLQPDGNRKLDYPLAYLRFNTIEPRNAEDNAVRGADKTWFYGVDDQHATSVRAYRVVNVMLDLDMHHVTNKWADTLKVMNAWMFAWRHNSLNFDVMYDGTKFGVKVQLQGDVQVPFEEGGMDEGIRYEFQGRIQVWGFVSQMVEVKKDVVKQVNISMLWMDNPDAPPLIDTAIKWDDPAVPGSQLSQEIPQQFVDQLMANDGDLTGVAVPQDSLGMRQVLMDLTTRLRGVYNVPQPPDGKTFVIDLQVIAAVYCITLTQDSTLSFINGSQDLDRRKFVVEVTQDSTGGWSLAPDSSVAIGAAMGSIDVSPEPEATDILGFMYHFATNKVRYLANSPGYFD